MISLSDQVIFAAAQAIEIDPRELIGTGRYVELVRARWAVMRALSARQWSTARIGRRLGRRDHTTVMHGLKRAAEMYASDSEFAALCDRVAAA